MGVAAVKIYTYIYMDWWVLDGAGMKCVGRVVLVSRGGEGVGIHT